MGRGWAKSLVEWEGGRDGREAEEVEKVRASREVCLSELEFLNLTYSRIFCDKAGLKRRGRLSREMT